MPIDGENRIDSGDTTSENWLSWEGKCRDRIEAKRNDLHMLEEKLHLYRDVLEQEQERAKNAGKHTQSSELYSLLEKEKSDRVGEAKDFEQRVEKAESWLVQLQCEVEAEEGEEEDEGDDGEYDPPQIWRSTLFKSFN